MKFFAKMKSATKGCFGVRVEPNGVKQVPIKETLIIWPILRSINIY
jgi:hypothetical protein